MAAPRWSMRAWLAAVALAGACDAPGVIKIQDPEGLDSDAGDVVGTDTDRPGRDTDRPGHDTDVAVDSGDSASADSGADTGDTGGNPFDAARLAWDGRVVHDFTGYVGAYGCKATLIEQGEELTGTAVSAGLRASCTTCDRFFEVRVQVQGTNCLQDWGQTEWRALEERPTGLVKVVEIYTGMGGGPVPRDPYPNVPRSGDTLAWKTSRSAFPIYQTEKVRGTVTLTPIP